MRWHNDNQQNRDWQHRHAPASELSIVDADADAHERREKDTVTGWDDRLRADFVREMPVARSGYAAPRRVFRPVASHGVVHRSPAQRQSGRRRGTEET